MLGFVSKMGRMAQPSLFDSSDIVIDEGRGRFIYTAGFVQPALASRWLAELREGAAWRTQKRMMYDREVDVARLLGHFRLDAPLGPGSLFVMDYATQLHYTHAIPKTSDVVGERISLAFRVKPPKRGE